MYTSIIFRNIIYSSNGKEGNRIDSINRCAIQKKNRLQKPKIKNKKEFFLTTYCKIVNIFATHSALYKSTTQKRRRNETTIFE